MMIRSVVLRTIANMQTDKQRVKHNLLRRGKMLFCRLIFNLFTLSFKSLMFISMSAFSRLIFYAHYNNISVQSNDDKT